MGTVANTQAVTRLKGIIARHREMGLDPYCLTLLIGYGLFRAVHSLTYSTGMSTVVTGHPLDDNLAYAFVASLAMVACSCVVGPLAWRRPSLSLRVPGVVCLLLLPVLNLLSSMGLVGLLPEVAATVVLPAVSGAAQTLASFAWLIPLARLRARRGLATFVTALLMGSGLVCLLSYVEAPARSLCLLACGVGSVALFVRVCAMDPGPDVAPAQGDDPLRGMSPRCRLAGACAELWSPLVVFACLNVVTTLVTVFQIASMPGVTGGPLVRNVALLVANAGMVALALLSDSMFSIRRIFRRSFPAIALLMAALPFMDHAYGIAFNAGLVMLNGVVSACALFMVLESSRMWRLPVVSMLALMMGGVQMLVALALGVGKLMEAQTRIDETVQAFVLIVVSLYLLSLALFAPKRPAILRRREAPGMSMDELDELVGPAPIAAPASAPSPEAQEAAPDAPAPVAEVVDAPVATPDEAPAREGFARIYLLTPREEQVARMLARGRSAAYVAQELGLATNTVRGYVQGIYTKLGVHSKQELIDLIG